MTSLTRTALRFALASALLLLPASYLDAHDGMDQTAGHGHDAAHGHGTPDRHDQWEGSPAGTAYSEFNHHLAGVFVIVIGLSEAGTWWHPRSLGWLRVLLPASMAGAGIFLLIWSDHNAWPIGAMSVRDTFLTGEWETVQHKWFGILLLAIAVVEGIRRSGKATRPWTRFPLPIFAILGGLSLFFHSHGAHPAAHAIAMHHAIMGAMAVTAGSSKLMSGRRSPTTPTIRPAGDLAWAAFVLLIGIQLLVYSES
ncbi:hypothetical protein [Candidatus Nitrospira bockiana]